MKDRKKKIIIGVVAVIVGIAILAGIRIYKAVMKPNVVVGEPKEFSLYIPTGADFEQVKDSLYSHGLIANPDSFEELDTYNDKECNLWQQDNRH